MRGKLGFLALTILLIPAVPLAMPAHHESPVHLPAVTTVWPAGTTGDASAGGVAPLLPAVAPNQRAATSTASSGSSYYYVGADSQPSSALSNSGVGATIQVVSVPTTSGCLSFWVADDSSANIWGQVGYYLCSGSVPLAFYQVWNLNTYTVLVTATTPVTTGAHRFSMYWQSGSVWAFALDGSTFGTQNLGSSAASSTYPVEALSEEGPVSTTWNPPQVQFEDIQVMSAAGEWAPVSTGFAPYGCGTTGYTCWGAAGYIQNPSIPSDAVVVGGTTPTIPVGTVLWDGIATTTSSSSVTSTSSTVSTSFTSSVTSTASTSTTMTSSTTSSRTGMLGVLLTVSPSSNARRSTEYFSVHVTDQNGNTVAGASVTLTVVRPDGRSSTSSVSTDSSGVANFQYKLNPVAPLGTYSVSAAASFPGYLSGTATGSFNVN
jgi:MG2 domain